MRHWETARQDGNLTPSACSAVPPAPLALARGFALYDEGTTTHALHTHRRIQTHTHKTMRCELQSVVPDTTALLQAAPTHPATPASVSAAAGTGSQAQGKQANAACACHVPVVWPWVVLGVGKARQA